MNASEYAQQNGLTPGTEEYNAFIRQYKRGVDALKSSSPSSQSSRSSQSSQSSPSPVSPSSPLTSPLSSSPVSSSSNLSCIYKLNSQTTVIKSDNKKRTVYPITIGQPRELISGDELRLVTDEDEFQRGGRKRKSRKNRYTKNSRRTKHSRRTRHSKRTKRTRRNK